MGMLKQSKTLLALSLTLILLSSCGGNSLLKSFRVALASSGPLVNSLVAAGAIPQSKATAIIADFDAGAACGLALQNDFAAAQSRADKLAASQRALTCFRTIINRQNFASHPKVQNAANIAEGILNSLVIFYSDSGSTADGPRRASVKRESEKAFEDRMEAQVEALKAALKP